MTPKEHTRFASKNSVSEVLPTATASHQGPKKPVTFSKSQTFFQQSDRQDFVT